MPSSLSALPGLAVVGTASAFPDREGCCYSNEEAWRALLGPGFRAELGARGWDADHPWTAWGVRRRHWSVVPGEQSEGSDTATESLALAAARAALSDAGLSPGELGLVVAATSTPGRISSALAARLCRELGTSAPGIDVRGGGAGGLHAWLAASTMLSAGVESALIVAAEAPSESLNPREPATALLYGDGAGALVLRRRPDCQGGLARALFGSLHVTGRPFTIPGPLPPRRTALEQGQYRFQSPDADYARGMLAAWSRAADELRPLAGEAGARWLIASGATAAQIAVAEEAFGNPAPWSRRVLEERGCTGCAAPLIALDALRRAEDPRAGARVAAIAVGGGVAWATLVWEF